MEGEGSASATTTMTPAYGFQETVASPITVDPVTEAAAAEKSIPVSEALPIDGGQEKVEAVEKKPGEPVEAAAEIPTAAEAIPTEENGIDTKLDLKASREERLKKGLNTVDFSTGHVIDFLTGKKKVSDFPAGSQEATDLKYLGDVTRSGGEAVIEEKLIELAVKEAEENETARIEEEAKSLAEINPREFGRLKNLAESLERCAGHIRGHEENLRNNHEPWKKHAQSFLELDRRTALNDVRMIREQAGKIPLFLLNSSGIPERLREVTGREILPVTAEPAGATGGNKYLDILRTRAKNKLGLEDKGDKKPETEAERVRQWSLKEPPPETFPDIDEITGKTKELLDAQKKAGEGAEAETIGVMSSISNIDKPLVLNELRRMAGGEVPGTREANDVAEKFEKVFEVDPRGIEVDIRKRMDENQIESLTKVAAGLLVVLCGESFGVSDKDKKISWLVKFIEAIGLVGFEATLALGKLTLDVRKEKLKN